MRYFFCKWDVLLVANNGGNDVSCATVVAKFAQIHPLPSAKVESATTYWDSEWIACESTFGVGRHIIVALESVAKIWLSFGNDVVENVSKVGLHIGVGIFVDAKSRRSVLDE